MSPSADRNGKRPPPVTAPARRSPSSPTMERGRRTDPAATAPVPIQPRSVVARATKSSAASPLGCSERVMRVLECRRRQSPRSGSAGGPRPRGGAVCSPLMTERRMRRVRAAFCRPAPRPRAGQGREWWPAELGNSVPGILDGDAQDESEHAAEQRADARATAPSRRRVLEPQVDLRLAGRGGVAQGVGPVRRHGTSARWGPPPRGARQAGCASRSRRRRRCPEARGRSRRVAPRCRGGPACRRN